MFRLRTTLPLIALLGALSLFCIFLFFSIGHRPVKNPRHIHLRTGVIDTTRTSSLGGSKLSTSVFGWLFADDPKLSVSYKKQVKSFLLHLDEQHYHNNHIDGRLDAFEKKLIELGVQLGKYIPHNTYMVTGTTEQLDNAKSLFP